MVIAESKGYISDVANIQKSMSELLARPPFKSFSEAAETAKLLVYLCVREREGEIRKNLTAV